MIFEVCDLIPEQERFSNKNIDWVWKILDKNDINISRHSLKRWPPGGNTVDPWKKSKQHSNQLGAKKESDDESSKFIKVMFSIWQWQRKTFLSINRWTSIHIIAGGNVVQRQSKQQLMWSHSCIWISVKKMHTIKIDYGTICFEAQRYTSPHQYGWWTSLTMPNHFFA